MPNYPLIIRNRTPWLVRVMMVGWLLFSALVTWGVSVQSPPPVGPLWPYALGVFLIAGLAVLAKALWIEEAALTIEGPGRAEVRRGRFWHPVTTPLTTIQLKLEKSKSSEGDDYYRLQLLGPPRPLTIAEGGRRYEVDAVRQEIEAAFAGKVIGELPTLA